MEKTAADLRADSGLFEAYRCSPHVSTAQDYGERVATSLFVFMLNPENRGPNFTWAGFEDMAAGRAEVDVFMCFGDQVWKRYGPLIQEDAVRSARLRAQGLLKNSGVETWPPLPKPA